MEFLICRFEHLSGTQAEQIKSLSLKQLDKLGEVILDLADLAALDAWLQKHH
ncbi:DUF4351 domain-containing protein [Phormidium sp. FACHB-322]|nr:DUF4351 domain-containing protein [Phormidium sp. FACHB-77]MBD2029288.1 DUF4351 domain-containing protein [Phormidium sp. FACHB-322]MBD2049278.1 DUF4351 domain-containing protein [Leptolyngbya sp. FACHB-60]